MCSGAKTSVRVRPTGSDAVCAQPRSTRLATAVDTRLCAYPVLATNAEIVRGEPSTRCRMITNSAAGTPGCCARISDLPASASRSPSQIRSAVRMRSDYISKDASVRMHLCRCTEE